MSADPSVETDPIVPLSRLAAQPILKMASNAPVGAYAPPTRRPCKTTAAKRPVATTNETSSINVVELSAVDARHLARLVEQITANPVREPSEYIAQAEALSRQAPDSVFEASATLHPSGAVLYRGLEVGPLPGTPSDNSQGLARFTLLGKEQMLIASLFGKTVSYEAEGYGHILQDMVPAKDKAFIQCSLGSEVELENHTEQASSLQRPDLLTLGCLRSDVTALTYLMSVQTLLAQLSDADVRRLRQPRWTFEVDLSFRAAVLRPDEPRGPWAILGGDPEDWTRTTLLMDLDMGWGISRADQELLMSLLPIYQQHRTGIALRKGDVLVFDNNVNMHGRSPFSPRYDGYDRWISRGFITRDLARSAHARGVDSRMILARFF